MKIPVRMTFTRDGVEIDRVIATVPPTEVLDAFYDIAELTYGKEMEI